MVEELNTKKFSVEVGKLLNKREDKNEPISGGREMKEDEINKKFAVINDNFRIMDKQVVDLKKENAMLRDKVVALTPSAPATPPTNVEVVELAKKLEAEKVAQKPTESVSEAVEKPVETPVETPVEKTVETPAEPVTEEKKE